MNVADSQRVASALEHQGYQATAKIEDAQVIVLNTCVVRQSAEDKAVGRLSSLKPLKENNPEITIPTRTWFIDFSRGWGLMSSMNIWRGSETRRATKPM